MSNKPPQPPNSVPEEDLSLHENFAPIIAENGLIRQQKAPEVNEESLPAFLTRLDTLQDLVELRHAEQEETQETLASIKEVSAADSEIQETVSENLPTEPATNSSETTSADLPTALRELSTEIVPVSEKTFTKTKKKSKPKRANKKPQTKQPEQQTSAAVSTPKRNRRWPWVLAVLLFLFLGGISGLVPVEKIPLLRELAYAMGFSKEDTSRMSFLRALLTWTDKTIGLPGNWGGDSAAGRSALARRGLADTAGDMAASGAAGVNARMASAGGKTSLINMQALNELQRKKGYAVDNVRGAVKLNPGQEEADLGPAALRDDAVNVRTESGRVQGDVYFGSDTSAINRNFKDGYDSVKTLARVKNPHIANGVPIDWLTNMTKRTMQNTMALGGVNREVEGTKISWGDGIADVGDKKEHRDLYHAWITSRMSKYTPNLMLKKGLADSAFLGAELPTTASNVLSFTGIQVDIASFNEDQTAWQEYLEWEKNCKEELQNRAGKNVAAAENDFRKIVQEQRANFEIPNCYDMVKNSYSTPSNTFSASAKNVANICDSLDKGYKTLNEVCSMKIFPSDTDCKLIQTNYEQRWITYYNECNNAYQTAKDEWLKQWEKDHPDEQAPADPYFLDNVWQTDGKSKTEQTIMHSTTIAKVETDGTGFATWIKATCVEGTCIPLDMDAEGHSESVKNVQQTIQDGIIPKDLQ